MERISVYDETYGRLERYADEHDTTVAEIIEDLVDEYLDDLY